MTQVVKIDKPIKNYLMDFGLTEKEVKLYLALLKTGPNTIMNLARETGIKRSTTHNNVEELIKKGLVSQTNYGERRMVVAEDPGKLSFLLEQKKWDMKKLEDNMTEIVGMIKQSVPENADNAPVEVKYYEGSKGVKLIYEDALSSKELRSYVNLEIVSKVFPENSDMFVNAQKRNTELKIWEIIDSSQKSKELASTFSQSDKYFYKFTKPGISLTAADVLIFDNKVAIVNVKEKTSGFVITNSDYYENSKAIFDFVWQNL